MCRFALVLWLIASPIATAEDEPSRLVRQLGSSVFEEREAATKALQILGEKAIPALKRASASNDPEVRRRATQLLRPFAAKLRMLEIEAIRKSRLTPLEKGRKLAAFITKKAAQPAVEQILGKGKTCLEYQDRENGDCVKLIYFKRFALQVLFVSHQDEEVFQVDRLKVSNENPVLFDYPDDEEK